MAADEIDGAVAFTTSPESGSTFPLVKTTVTVQSADKSGNKTSGGFVINVVDTVPPAIITAPKSLSLEAASKAGTVATFAGTATDLVDGAVTIVFSQASGSTFPIGMTTVSYYASDKSGNPITGSFQVRVGDVHSW